MARSISLDIEAPSVTGGPDLESINLKRKLAELLMRQGVDTSPVGHWTQAAARGLQGIVGALQNKNAASEQSALRGGADEALLGLLQPQSAPQPAPSPAPAIDKVTAALAPAQFNDPAPMQNPPVDQRQIPQMLPDSAVGPQAAAQAQLDPNLVESVKGFEGYAPRAQWDYKQHSGGYGTRAAPGEVFDKPKAEARLAEELIKAKTIVQNFAPDAPAGVQKALTDLTFNAGDDWTRAGLGAAVKRGDYEDAAQRFVQYNKAGGRPLQGLIDRRGVGAKWMQEQPQAPMQVADASGQSAPSPDQQMVSREQLQKMLANPYTRDLAQKLIMQQMPKPVDEMGRAELDYKRAQTDKLRREAVGGGATEYGLNPQYATDDKGKIVPWVPGKDGSPKMIQLPGGATPLTPAQLYEDRAVGRERGEVMGKNQGNLPAAEYNAGRLIQSVDALRKDPYLPKMLGPIDQWLPNVSGDANRVQSKVDQIQGKTFLQAFDSLRGAGQITENEGRKATESLNRLQSMGMNDPDYADALNEFKKDVTDLLEVARRKAGGRSSGPIAGSGITHRWNPQTGRLDAVGGP